MHTVPYRLTASFLVVSILTPVLAAQSVPSGGISLGGSKPKASAVRVAGPSSSNLSVTRVDLGAATAESAPFLTGIKLLSIDVSGRTPLTDLDGVDARVVAVAAAANAVQLPGSEAIRIFHYQIPAAKRFGFFSVRGAGLVELLIERPGLGSSLTVDPFDPIIGAARDGRTIAITASDPNQGVDGIGDTWLLRVDGSTFAAGNKIVELTGAPVREISGSSLTFFGSNLLAVEDDTGIVRAPIDGSSGFSPVALPPSGGVAPAEIEPEIARSADGKTLAILAGATESALDVYRVDLPLSIVNVSNDPQPIVAPGFLPEEAQGPLLALAPDGSFLAYQLDLLAGNEFFVRAFQPGSTTHHLTSDPAFDTSIDQMSGILTGGSFVRFLASSGQLNADLYRSSLPALGVPTLQNLTKTSGAADPFFPNTAELLVASQSNLRGGRLLTDTGAFSGQGQALWWSGATDATALVQSGLSVPPRTIAASIAPARVAIVTRSGSQSNLLVYDGVNAPQPLLPMPSGVPIESVAGRDGGFVFGFVADLAGQDYVVQVGAMGGALQIVPGSPYTSARDLLYARDGRLLFVATQAGKAQTFALGSVLAPPAAAGAPADVAFWLR